MAAGTQSLLLLIPNERLQLIGLWRHVTSDGIEWKHVERNNVTSDQSHVNSSAGQVTGAHKAKEIQQWLEVDMYTWYNNIVMAWGYMYFVHMSQITFTEVMTTTSGKRSVSKNKQRISLLTWQLRTYK